MGGKISFYAGFGELIQRLGIKTAAKTIKEYGFDGVEFLFMAEGDGIPSTEIAKEYGAALEENGLVTACVSCGASLVKASSPTVTDTVTVENLCRGVDFTGAVGSKLFHHTLYLNVWEPPTFNYDDAYEAVLKGAELVADYAKEQGITVIYEPQGWFFNGCRGFSDFYNKIKQNHDNVGVCYDFGNTCWVDESPLDFLEQVKGDVLHAHIKDYVIGGEEAEYKTLSGNYIKEVTVGSGELPLSEITASLKELGYHGFFSIEDATGESVTKKLCAVKDLLKTN